MPTSKFKSKNPKSAKAKARKIVKRYFGVTKVKTGTKLAWVSRHTKHGWSLALALGKRDVYLTNIKFASVEEVERALKSSVVFVHLKEEGKK